MEKLTNFIKETCGEYSEFLFLANKTLGDIKEIDIIKNALNERYKIYKKVLSIKEAESVQNKEQHFYDESTKEMLIKQKTDLEDKYNDCLLNLQKKSNDVEVKDNCLIT